MHALTVNFHNKHCNNMITGNYSILLIGDSIIAALPRYSNVWKRYFQLLNAVNYGIYGDRGQNISWRCQNITSSSNPQYAIIMCGTKNIKHSSVEDTMDGIVEISLLLRHKYHPITIFACQLLSYDNNWSINRVCIDVINNYLCCKSTLNDIS